MEFHFTEALRDLSKTRPADVSAIGVSILIDYIEELEAARRLALEKLPLLYRGHNYCEDSWYSCPKAEEGCSDKTQGKECNCGADRQNAILAEITKILQPPEDK